MTPDPEEQYIYESLNVDRHNRAAFSCGNDALDRYFKERARKEHQANIATCFVLFDRAERVVIGFYTLSASQILANDLPPAVAKRLRSYSHLPATLIGRLAIDRRFQGQGRGGDLLMDALHRAAETAWVVGSVAVVVDAKREAVTWYLRFGFEPLSDNPHHLFLPMTTIRQMLSP